MFGISALRASDRWPRAWLTVAARLSVPRLCSNPRRRASCNDSAPSSDPLPRVLPLKAPCTWSTGLTVEMLPVTPGTGDSTAVTVPPGAERPLSGTGAGCAGPAAP